MNCLKASEHYTATFNSISPASSVTYAKLEESGVRVGGRGSVRRGSVEEGRKPICKLLKLLRKVHEKVHLKLTQKCLKLRLKLAGSCSHTELRLYCRKLEGGTCSLPS